MLKYSGEVKKCSYFAIFLDYNPTTNYYCIFAVTFLIFCFV